MDIANIAAHWIIRLFLRPLFRSTVISHSNAYEIMHRFVHSNGISSNQMLRLWQAKHTATRVNFVMSTRKPTIISIFNGLSSLLFYECLDGFASFNVRNATYARLIRHHRNEFAVSFHIHNWSTDFQLYSKWFSAMCIHPDMGVWR